MSQTEKRKVDKDIDISQLGKRRKQLVIPKRKKVETNEVAIATLKQVKKMNKEFKELQKDYYQCGACAEKLYPPYPRSLKRLIEKVHRNETQYFEEQKAAHERLVKECEKEGKTIPVFTYVKSGISKNDQDFICRMHKVELIYRPMAVKEGYPQHIEFEKIASRMKEFQEELEEIIDKKKPSIYLDNLLKVFEEVGAVKARQGKHLINRFDQTLPGYYGNRGSHYIMEALNDMFLKTNKIDKETTKPLTPVEFIQQVLVPETGSRLIRQDYKINDLKQCQDIMKNSIEYGSIVYNKIK